MPGVPRATTFTSKFQTNAPGATATYPTNAGAFSVSGPVVHISPWTPIEISFTEPMDPTTLTASTFYMTDSIGATIAGAIDYDPSTNTAILDPTAMLKWGETYTVTATRGILAALDGAPLDQIYTWQFTVSTVATPFGSTVPVAFLVKADARYQTVRGLVSPKPPMLLQ